MIRLAAAGRVLSELVFPCGCLACEAGTGLGEDSLCPACADGLAEQSAQHYCGGCGATAGLYAAADGRCSACRGKPWPIVGMTRVGAYEGRLRDLLLAFKYQGREELDRFFGRRLAEVLRAPAWFDEVEALLAVPTCWHRRLLGRPYLATAIARQAARAVGLVDLPLLRRVRGGPSQVGLNRTQRMANVRGAFRLARGVKLNQAVVCLVDDVATTGATLGECARVLKQAGASRVFAAVVCRQHSAGVA